MHKILAKIEEINSRIIPFALILLVFVIIFEIFVHIENTLFLQIIHGLDYAIITVFVIELTFGWHKSSSVRLFFKDYWLEIIAVLPLGLIFSGLSKLTLFSEFTRTVLLGERVIELERIAIGQSVLHEAAYVSKWHWLSEMFPRISRTSVRIFRLFALTKKKHFSNQ